MLARSTCPIYLLPQFEKSSQVNMPRNAYLRRETTDVNSHDFTTQMTVYCPKQRRARPVPKKNLGCFVLTTCTIISVNLPGNRVEKGGWVEGCGEEPGMGGGGSVEGRCGKPS